MTKPRRWRRPLLILGVLAVGMLPAPALVAAAPPIGLPAPDFELETDDGSTFVLSEVSLPVVLVFWAEW